MRRRVIGGGEEKERGEGEKKVRAGAAADGPTFLGDEKETLKKKGKDHTEMGGE